MKKRFVVVMNFILGVLILLTRLFQKHNSQVYFRNGTEKWITIALLALTWGTSFIILAGMENRKEKDD